MYAYMYECISTRRYCPNCSFQTNMNNKVSLLTYTLGHNCLLELEHRFSSPFLSSHFLLKGDVVALVEM